MNPAELALWQRIEAHAFDDPESPHPFSLRLGKENDWGPHHTERVLAEYRRFAFLAVAAGHPVSPSAAVDEAWHLHLLYTRDYWGIFCGRVLGTPLHHGPARGGAIEAAKFCDWYSRTLASYRRFFGAPPADLWPERPVHPKIRHVDLAHHWVVPKPLALVRLARCLRGFVWSFESSKRTRAPEAVAAPRQPATASPLALSLLALGLLGLAPQRASAATSNSSASIFDLSGPEFLLFFLGLGAVLIVVAGVTRFWLRGRSTPFRQRTDELDPYEVALLANGRNGAFHAALVSLHQRGLISLQPQHATRAGDASSSLPLLERAIHGATSGESAGFARLERAAGAALDSLERSLTERGLLLDASARLNTRLIPATIVAIAPAIGIIKIGVGLSRERPVAFLVILSVLTAGVALAFALKTPRRSRRGDARVAELRRQHADLQGTLRSAPAGGGPDFGLMLPLAVGLFGVSALYGTPLEGTARQIAPPPATGGDGSFSGDSSSSDSGGGDSGGGGGDGGGGGCGGCGGGGGD